MCRREGKKIVGMRGRRVHRWRWIRAGMAAGTCGLRREMVTAWWRNTEGKEGETGKEG
jgi:hypothetical protein